MIEINYGEVKFLEPIKYTVREVVSGPWWWLKKEWYIQSEFGSFGPFDDPKEVVKALNILNK